MRKPHMKNVWVQMPGHGEKQVSILQSTAPRRQQGKALSKRVGRILKGCIELGWTCLERVAKGCWDQFIGVNIKNINQNNKNYYVYYL